MHPLDARQPKSPSPPIGHAAAPAEAPPPSKARVRAPRVAYSSPPLKRRTPCCPHTQAHRVRVVLQGSTRRALDPHHTIPRGALHVARRAWHAEQRPLCMLCMYVQ